MVARSYAGPRRASMISRQWSPPHPSALDLSTSTYSTLDTSAPDTSATDTSTLDAPAPNTSTLDTSAPDTSTLDASAPTPSRLLSLPPELRLMICELVVKEYPLVIWRARPQNSDKSRFRDPSYLQRVCRLIAEEMEDPVKHHAFKTANTIMMVVTDLDFSQLIEDFTWLADTENTAYKFEKKKPVEEVIEAFINGAERPKLLIRLNISEKFRIKKKDADAGIKPWLDILKKIKFNPHDPYFESIYRLGHIGTLEGISELVQNLLEYFLNDKLLMAFTRELYLLTGVRERPATRRPIMGFIDCEDLIDADSNGNDDYHYSSDTSEYDADDEDASSNYGQDDCDDEDGENGNASCSEHNDFDDDTEDEGEGENLRVRAKDQRTENEDSEDAKEREAISDPGSDDNEEEDYDTDMNMSSDGEPDPDDVSDDSGSDEGDEGAIPEEVTIEVMKHWNKACQTIPGSSLASDGMTMEGVPDFLYLGYRHREWDFRPFRPWIRQNRRKLKDEDEYGSGDEDEDEDKDKDDQKKLNVADH